ncbi:carboxylesterase family protein [Methyloradius palustris]|uniref:BD-FAE-like domain-containing protein n=1 Tax=Methyloradius palustris TaxID=2778876 RepID=A0A8D5G2Z7_9PROT|nr:alpha/beta hydrolase [Methyloradius palustris]BCM24750.1 hypothetical protein ZMTM_10090 [Methyloradius palustris]
MKLLKFCGAFLILTCLYQTANAGPFLDKLKARMAERQQGTEADDGGMGSSQSFTLPAGATLKSDIPYGSDKAQRMDVYIPQNAQNAPVIFMVHGGGWKRGDKAMNRVVENKVNRWLPKGIIFVSTNYRMLPDADPLVQANDVALALAKAQSLAASWGGDSKRFVIMGHSAGAHLVALITASPSIAKQQGAQPWLGTVMLDSAGYDIEKVMTSKHMGLYDNAFGTDTSFWHKASPSDQMTQKTVPMLAVCSTQRKDQPCPKQAQPFVDKAVALGTKASTLPEALSHGEINENLGLPSDYTDQVEKFMRYLGLSL